MELWDAYDVRGNSLGHTLIRGEEIPAGFYPVQVEIGIQDNYNVEIKSGVEEGTVVFTQIMSDNVWG